MSFLNKLWKNLRDGHKSSGGCDHLPTHQLQQQQHAPVITGKKSSSKSRDLRVSSIEHPDHQYQQYPGGGTRRYNTLNARSRTRTAVEVNENIAPPSSHLKRSSGTRDPLDAGRLTDDSGFEVGDSSSEEFQLPPGILSDLSKHPTVSRHLSVSRSGRYKQRNKMRSNLFDVVKRDGDDEEAAGSRDLVDLDKEARGAREELNQRRQQQQQQAPNQGRSTSVPTTTASAGETPAPAHQRFDRRSGASRKAAPSETCIDAEVHAVSSSSNGSRSHARASGQQQQQLQQQPHRSSDQQPRLHSSSRQQPPQPHPRSSSNRCHESSASDHQQSARDEQQPVSSGCSSGRRMPLAVQPPVAPMRHSSSLSFSQDQLTGTRASAAGHLHPLQQQHPHHRDLRSGIVSVGGGAGAGGSGLSAVVGRW